MDVTRGKMVCWLQPSEQRAVWKLYNSPGKELTVLLFGVIYNLSFMGDLLSVATERQASLLNILCCSNKMVMDSYICISFRNYKKLVLVYLYIRVWFRRQKFRIPLYVYALLFTSSSYKVAPRLISTTHLSLAVMNLEIHMLFMSSSGLNPWAGSRKEASNLDRGNRGKDLKNPFIKAGDIA